MCCCHQAALRHVSVPSILRATVPVDFAVSSSEPILHDRAVQPDRFFYVNVHLLLRVLKSSPVLTWHLALGRFAGGSHSRRIPLSGQSAAPVLFRYWVFQSAWSVAHAINTYASQTNDSILLCNMLHKNQF